MEGREASYCSLPLFPVWASQFSPLIVARAILCGTALSTIGVCLPNLSPCNIVCGGGDSTSTSDVPARKLNRNGNITTMDTSKIDRWQKERQKAFKSIPAAGKTITYLGKKFFVYRNTFWPFKDSQPLVKNLRIKKTESVLDVGTGSGVIAVFACYRGAGRVVAVDINPSAVKSAKRNAKLHGFDKVIEIKHSNLFENVKQEKFDVITANLPFRNRSAHDVVARSQWDTDLKTNKQFFKRVGKYLKPNGRIYFAQANFGAVKEIKMLAKAAGFSISLVGRGADDKRGTKKFYAFLLRRARQS